MKKFVVIALVLGVFILPNLGFSAKMITDDEAHNQAMNIAKRITFAEESPEQVLDNGLQIKIVAPCANISGDESGTDYYIFTGKNYKYNYIDNTTVAVSGIALELTNTSDNVIVIRWSESALISKSHSGVPLDNWLYYNVYNDQTNPDTFLVPRQKLSKSIYLSRLKRSGRDYHVVGESMPRNGGLTFDLILKVVDSNNNSKYYNFKTPLMVVK